jgi:hypothetical protein|nr:MULTISPECIES: hypothetical protein [unclassified Microcystis]
MEGVKKMPTIELEKPRQAWTNLKQILFIPPSESEYEQLVIIAFLIHKRYIPDPEQLNQQRFKCAAQMREPLYVR